MQQNGTAVERHQRGWILEPDGWWRAYDGFDAEPLAELRLADRATTPQTFARMRDWLAEVAPAVRVVA
jgi:hypothetical protein